MLSTISSLCPKNERQRSVNSCMPCILKYQGAVRLSWSMIKLLTAFLGENTYVKIITMSRNERQRSVDDFWSCILDNVMAMGCRKPTVIPSAAPIRKNASDNIASASYYWAPTERQRCSWRLRMVYSDELRCTVPKSSFKWSVSAI